jgi:hypothetical protein
MGQDKHGFLYLENLRILLSIELWSASNNPVKPFLSTFSEPDQMRNRRSPPYALDQQQVGKFDSPSIPKLGSQILQVVFCNNPCDNP